MTAEGPSPDKREVEMEISAQWLVLAVAPSKIFFLFICMAFAEIHMMSMGFTFPTAVETYFSAIPHMIVIVIAVVNSIASAYARRTSGDDRG
jgi:uncharacterized membrane protein